MNKEMVCKCGGQCVFCANKDNNFFVQAYCDKCGIGTPLMASADIARKVWESMQIRYDDFLKVINQEKTLKSYEKIHMALENIDTALHELDLMHSEQVVSYDVYSRLNDLIIEIDVFSVEINKA